MKSQGFILNENMYLITFSACFCDTGRNEIRIDIVVIAYMTC